MLRTWACKSLTLELWALQTAITPLVGENTCRSRKSLPLCPHISSSLSPETMLSRVANWGLWYNMTSVTKTCEQSRNSNPAMVRQDSGLRETQWHSQTCNFLQLVPYEIRSPRAGLIVSIFLNGHLGKCGSCETSALDMEKVSLCQLLPRCGEKVSQGPHPASHEPRVKEAPRAVWAAKLRRLRVQRSSEERNFNFTTLGV